ncbi:MAG TPA: VWA domain-containing protein [Polyangia bacterium]
MRRSRRVVGFLVAGVLSGCGFAAGTKGPIVVGGSGGGSGGMDAGTSSGSGGRSGKGGSGSGGKGGSGEGGSGGTGFFGSGGGGDVGFGVDANCGQTSVSVMPVPPDILIVQDRSLSMTDNTDDKSCDGGTPAGDGNCGATSKWAQVTTALNQVVQQTETKVNWGLIFLGDEATTCGAATAPVVNITPGSSFSLIQAAINGVQFNGAIGTPTAAVMNNAVQYLTGLTDSNPKYLLLATDGEPNCATAGNVGATDDLGAENAVAAALTAGFPTFVVGIATTADANASNALNTMAVNGGEAQTGATTQYYTVSDTASLVSVLGKILGKALSCTIPLNGVGGMLDKVAVSAKDANGNPIEIMQDDTNGWSYTDPTKTAIILNGDACNNLQSVTYTDFQFIYTCASGMIKIG